MERQVGRGPEGTKGVVDMHVDFGPEEMEAALLELAYSWPDVEAAIDDPWLGWAIEKAFRIEAQQDYNSFNDPCTPYVLYFDVRDADARSAANLLRKHSEAICSIVSEKTHTWHSRYNFLIQVTTPGDPVRGQICRRGNEQHPPSMTPSLADVADEKPQSNVPLVDRDGYHLTPIEVPFYDALRETGLYFAVQPWIQGTDRKYRLDFLVFYDGGCVAVELDGHESHKTRE